MKNIENEDRAFRGSSWDDATRTCRASNRYGDPPAIRHHYLGFRVVHRRRKSMKNIDLDDRAFRGGSWCNSSASCRASFRSWGTPVCRYGYLGFRVLHRRRKP